ncbi:MAG: CRISPR-associated ring nuclease Csm6 [Melioribacteraceae bacterium]
MKTKNLLICVSGLTPQIVTEALFCLSYKMKIQIDEIYVLTTKRGRDVILGKDKAPTTPKSPLKNEIEEMCKMYKIKKPVFDESEKHIIVAKEESIELSDIRSDKDNILFPNKVCEFIRTKSSDPNNVLYCSITGGRKSMSVHLANALSIFARENDKLIHVLTKEEHEFKDFYPKSKKEINDLELAEIPFVRLRSLLSSEIKSSELLKLNFDEIVEHTQKQLKILAPSNQLVLDIERRELRFGNEKIDMEPMEFLFYFFFVESKEKGIRNISINEFVTEEMKNKFLEYFRKYYPNRSINESKWKKTNWDSALFLQRRSKVNKKIEDLIEDNDIANLFIIDSDRKWGGSTYMIKADINRFKIVEPRELK